MAKTKPTPYAAMAKTNSSLSPFAELLWAILPGLLCAFAILYPFLLSGGEFIYLDWAGTSGDVRALGTFIHSMQTNGFAARWLPHILLETFSAALLSSASSAIFPKLFFIALFAAASAGLWLLFKPAPRPIYLFAVAILCFSPFVYERILIGQWGVVAALFTAPLVLYFANRMVQSPSRAAAFWAALALTLGTLYLLQGLLLDVGLMALMFLLSFQAAPAKGRRALLEAAAAFALFFILLNLFWIIPVLLTWNPSVSFLQVSSSIGPFQPPHSSGLNTLFKSAAQYGIWREAPMQVGFILLPLWFILLVVVGLVGLSIYALRAAPPTPTRAASPAPAAPAAHSRAAFSSATAPPPALVARPLASALAIGWLAGLFLATGLTHPWTQSLFSALLNFPLFGGFRDSNKFVHLITLAFSILAPMGLWALMRAARASSRQIWAAGLTAILLILAYNYPAIGLGGQLRPVVTPAEYRTMADLVPAGEQALYLPTSIYQTYHWSLAIGMDGRVPNQASRFGYSSVITLFAPEVDFTANSPREARLAACVNAQNATCLVQNNQSIILFDFCSLAAGDYAWLYQNYASYRNGTCLYWYNLSAGPKQSAP